MKIQLHPDGTIYIHDDANEMLYCAAPAVFQTELKAALPPLPDGMVRFAYDDETKILVYYDAKGNAFPLEGQVEPPACLLPAIDTPVPIIEQLETARVEAQIDPAPVPTPVKGPATIPVAR